MQKISGKDNSYDGRIGLVYARVSSPTQAAYGHGLESQEARCISDLKSIGVPYEKTFPDSFTGGGDFMRRPAMRKLIEYIDANPHKRFVVIFDDLSRFARDVEFHIKLRAAFRVRDTLVRCLNFSFDDTPEGEFAEIIMAANNQLFRKQNRRQVIQKQKARLESGYWPFICKKGYMRVNHPSLGRILKPTALGTKVLKPALESFATGKLVRKIDVARFLLERGFWKKQLPHRYIHLVDAILRDPFHCGDIEYANWDVARRKGHHIGIISCDIYDLIQRRLKKGVNVRVRQKISDDFPLRGLITCSACERPLTAAWFKRRTYPYYYCQHRDCKLYYKTFHRKDVEGDFQELLARNRLRPDVSKVVETVFDRVWNQEINELDQQKQLDKSTVATLQEKITELSDMVRKARSEALQRAYEREIEQSTRKLEELELSIARGSNYSTPYRTAFGKVNKLLKNPHKAWQNVGALEKQRLFFFLFESKLQYVKKDGYRTGDLLSTTRLFEELATSNTSVCGPTGNRTPDSSMPWTRVTITP